MADVKVYLEERAKRTFACALDWPGWARSGRTPEAALAALAAYAPRYAPVAAAAGVEPGFDVEDVDPAGFVVVERVPGSASTDFGVPGAQVTADAAPRSRDDAARDARLLHAAWAHLAAIVAAAPPGLRKGPRGGGRDRDPIVRHVLEAEIAYAAKLGLRVPRSILDGAAEAERARNRVLEVLRAAAPPATASGWPTRYAARRFAWHALDHAWEIEDRY